MNMPFEYLAGFIRFLHKNNHIFNFITYNDLDWRGDYSPATMYKNEFEYWAKKKPNGNAKKINILIQHDVDSVPELSMKICQLENDLNVYSNVMIFNKRINQVDP